MTRENAYKAILEYFQNNEEDFNTAIEDLDSYNGYLGDDRYYPMDELDDIYSGTEPTEILYRAFYGYDEMYTTDGSGNREPAQFNPNREFFSFNGYGNLVSSDYKDYSAFLDNYFVSEYVENVDSLYNVPEEVQEIIDSIEE